MILTYALEEIYEVLKLQMEVRNTKSSLVARLSDKHLWSAPGVTKKTLPRVVDASLRAKRETVPDCLRLTAWTEDGLVMGVRHQELPRFGIQFHPESILTPTGDRMIGRFLAMTGDGGEGRGTALRRWSACRGVAG